MSVTDEGGHGRMTTLRFRRAMAAGLVTVLAVGGVLALGGPAAGDEEFIQGSGRSEARLVRLGPSTGRLSLAPTLGLTLADYLNTLGRGEARVLDYAALDDSVPPELKDQVPPVRVESTAEGSEDGKRVRFAGTPDASPVAMGATEQRAAAADGPKGESWFDLGTFEIPGVVAIDGGAIYSRAGLKGRVREAAGVAQIDKLSIGDGAAVLTGLRWEALQRTGDANAMTGSFSIEGAAIAGQKLAPPDTPAEIGALFEQVNGALAPLGLVVDPPTVHKDSGIARIGPLGLRVVNSPAGRQAFGPLLGAVQPLREPVTQALIDGCADCSTAVLLADVALGTLSGAGRFDVELGGAMAFTEGEAFDDPFGGGFDLGSAPGISDEPVADVGGDSPPGGSADLGDSGAGSDTSGSDAGVSARDDRAGAGDDTDADDGGGNGEEALAQPVSSVAGTTGGAALVVGLVGLGATLILAAGDYQRMKVGRRTIPDS